MRPCRNSLAIPLLLLVARATVAAHPLRHYFQDFHFLLQDRPNNGFGEYGFKHGA